MFEAEPKAGGMLVQAIPAYRLPRPELEREVRMIEAMGARFEYGKALGRDFTLKSLKDEGYEAVFVAVGAPQGMGIGVPGEDGPGVYDGLSFLKEYNVSGKGEVGKNVAVIGGGNAAIDAARTALRLGAESVKILYRRTRAQMPAWGEEIDAADLEGIDIMTLVAPEEILRDASGKVTGVRCKEMALGDYDRSGRRRPVAGHNPDFVVEADTVIAAIGQKLDAPAVLDGTPVELNRWGYLAADPNTGQTSIDWVFTGGDAATGPSSVVEAIGAGEKAAAAHGRVPDRRQPRLLAPRHRAADVLRPRRRPRAGRPPRGRGAGRGRPRHQLRRGRAELGRRGRDRRGETLPALRLRQVLLVSKES